MVTSVGALGDGNNYVQIRGLRSGQYLGFYHTRSVLNLQRGQSVQAGQIIGYTDLSGTSTGAHLHFTTQTGSGLGRKTRYDPIRYFHNHLPRVRINY